MNAGRRFSPPRTGRAASAALALLLCGPITAGAETEAAPTPIKFPEAQIEPLTWSAIPGWADDTQLKAFGAFMVSCKAILRSKSPGRSPRPVIRTALHEVCTRAVDIKPKDDAEARIFFEKNFRPVRIAPLGQTEGFITGYYEPIFDGSLTQTEEYSEPIYRRPPGLVGGKMMVATFAAKKKEAKDAKEAKEAKGKGKGKRKGRRFVPFHDRTAIENGVLAGRNLEICYLKDPIDSFFAQIQGSLRVRLDDGKMLRLNYSAANGHPYTAVGRFLIERNIITREEMSMDAIRKWMTANPEEGKELRRKNKSYVFFRETDLSDGEEAIGAQGISLTAWRSIAVDRKLHVYGTPFFISASLPIEGDDDVQFMRLMIAQDTGGAIVGPARADIYFGAGAEAGRISGRLKHNGQFVMLLPNSLDPVVAGKKLPLPKSRPVVSEAEPEAKAEAKVEARLQPGTVTGVVGAVPLPPRRPEAAKPQGPKQAGEGPAAPPATSAHGPQ